MSEKNLTQLKAEKNYVDIHLKELKDRTASTVERIRILTEKREAAWSSYTEAEDALGLATQALLIELDQFYRKAREQFDYFCAKYAIKIKQIEQSISLEEQFIKECSELQESAKKPEESNHWELCKRAHISRLHLYTEEKHRLDSYKEKSARELFEIEQEALCRIDAAKLETEDRKLKKANVEDTRRQFNAAEGLLDEARKTLDKIVDEYNQTEAESKRLQHEINKIDSVEVMDLN